MSAGIEQVDQAIDKLKEALVTLEEWKAQHSGPTNNLIFSSNVPLTGKCEVCDKGPLEWVQKLRDLEVTTHQRTSEWFEARKQCVTASELASVISENPYCSRVQTLKKKTGLAGDNFSTLACQHGNDNEDRAIEIYEQKTGHKVLSFGLMRSQVPGQTHIAGSPDGITCCGRLVEVKCPVSRKIIPGVVPKHYQSQIELLMHIANIEVADFVQMGTNQGSFDVTAFPRTEGYYESIKKKINTFIDMLNEVRADNTKITKYERKRKPKVKSVDHSKTFEAGFILE